MIIKTLSIISALGVVCSLSMVILWQSTQGKLDELQSKHTKLNEAYNSLVLSKEQLEASTKVTSDLIFNLNVELLRLKKEEEVVVYDLANYKPNCVAPKANTETKQDEIEYVNIDAPFEPDLLRLYKGSDNL